jgi:hypothetical protein
MANADLLLDKAIRVLGPKVASRIWKTGESTAISNTTKSGTTQPIKTLSKSPSNTSTKKTIKISHNSKARNRALHEKYKEKLRKKMGKPHVEDPQLAYEINKLYRKGAKKEVVVQLLLSERR